MKVSPNYPGEVIVLVKNKGLFSWYVSDKELWIMDLVKLHNAFRKAEGMPEEETTQATDEREGFEILTERNIDGFLEVIREYQVEYGQVKEYIDLYNLVYPDDDPELSTPAFYLDFDEKCFHSYFTEPGSYETYAPDGWRSLWHINRDFPQDLLHEAIGGKG